MRISRNAVDKAMRLREALEMKDYPIYVESPTNQLFVVVEDHKMEELAKRVGFNVIESVGNSHHVIRFASTWASTDKQIDELISLL